MATPLDNLVYCLGLAEGSATDALDLSGNGKTFTQVGTVPAATGKIVGARGPGVVSNHFVRASDDDMDLAGESFAIAVWSRVLSVPSPNINYSGLQCGFPFDLCLMDTQASAGNPYFRLADQFLQSVVAFGPPVNVGEWCWLFAWYDAVAGEIGIQANNGEAETVPFTGSALGTAGLEHYVLASGSDALLEQLCFWKGRVPSQAERDGLYNGGAGVTFDAFGDINQPTTRLRMDHRYLRPRVR